ncbi:RagB/SusD family nutrient uptake outer membrane protein [Polaribacter sp. IC073]|uniref:RagB/SusD family nutrient uptake outer membrane protein n=1 Tax=Polaribacter sp. IC073 TaxID=2508540 RepID=UPI0011BE4CB8|nr:RagB/SusD family nutrient uptake outer membrane protein [Polaribacter sp. IC073]TXD45797.1 RagB/SusD family nutrient uptake outer membrane protein [Polaribacter sp. IC073]
MKLYNKIHVVVLCLLVAITTSCTNDYLDVSDELVEEVTMEQVFSRPASVRQFHRNIFTGITNSSNMIFGTDYQINGLDNPWAGATDELKMAQGPLRNLTSNGFNAGNAPFHRWNLLYPLIRQANLFLENAKVIPQSGSADYIDEDQLSKLKAQARFLRAYYHYLLFELYGPIPIMATAVDPSSADLDFSRNSVDEVISFIDAELIEVAGELNDKETSDAFLALPTKGVALAVKAKLWMYAASPLLNGGYVEALAIENPEDGKKIFPAFDNTKWQKALNATKELIDFAENGNYELYRNSGVFDPHASLYELFNQYNDEIIWANPNSDWGSLSYDGTDRRLTPRSERSGFASIAVTQELVDDFFMLDGLPINESPTYTENGFSVDGDDQSGQTSVGTYKMWINREPRFYQTVMFHGRKWHYGNNLIKFNKGSGNDNSSENYPWSGYLLYKRLDKTIRNEGSFPRSKYRPSIVFRLAEFYLLYAEALNEVNPSDSKILEYVDKVRERAGIPKLSVIKSEIQGNQQAQRLAIRKEMRVELATEGQRYFDVRRWMIADQPEGNQGGPFYGMNMNGLPESEFFERTTYENRVWDKRMYLYPIPLVEIQKSTKLIQNPLW